MPKTLELEHPEFDKLVEHIRASAALRLPLVIRDAHWDAPGALIVGLGNSLMAQDTLREIRRRSEAGWIVFAIKEAITYLTRRGIPVRYAVNMDPGPGEALRTPVDPAVTYCVAATCHPELYRHLLDGGARVLVFFNASGARDYRMTGGIVIPLGDGSPGSSNQRAVILGVYELATNDAQPGYPFCPVCTGVKDEEQLYRELFGVDDPVTIGNGFTVGNRAVMLARFMGITAVAAAGLDFGWREGSGYYAPFVDAEPMDSLFFEDRGRVDGTPWMTRADLLGSAAELANLIRDGRCEIIGDSLAASLARLDAATVRELIVKFVPPGRAKPAPKQESSNGA